MTDRQNTATAHPAFQISRRRAAFHHARRPAFPPSIRQNEPNLKKNPAILIKPYRW